MHAGEVERESSFVVGDDGEDADQAKKERRVSSERRERGERRDSPRSDGVTLVPFVLSVERIGETEENVGVVCESILCFQTSTDDGDLSKVFVLMEARLRRFSQLRSSSLFPQLDTKSNSPSSA